MIKNRVEKINIDTIGDVNININSKRKKLAIITNAQGITAELPKYSLKDDKTYIQILDFAIEIIKENRDRLLKSIEEFKSNDMYKKIFKDPIKYLSTSQHKLRLVGGSSTTKCCITINDSETTVCFPNRYTTEDKVIQDLIKTAYLSTLKKEAESYLPSRLQMWSEKFDLPYNKLSLKNTKTRWGSCSSSHNINLNIHLMRLDSDIIDMVLIHELLHTLIPNHSSKFHDTMEKLISNYKEKNEYLKTTHLPFMND